MKESSPTRGWDSGQDGAAGALKVFVGREETKPLTEEQDIGLFGLFPSFFFFFTYQW